MARKWSNLNLPGALHFVTGATLNRVPIFELAKNCRLFFDVLGEVSADWPCKLIAYVVMPDHIHVVCNPRDGRIKEFMGSLKSLSANRICGSDHNQLLIQAETSLGNPIYRVWQQSFKALPLWSAWMVWQKINYIHANPVKARLCSTAKDYAWSSFRAFYDSANEPIAVDANWWWPEDAEKLLNATKALDKEQRGINRPSGPVRI